MTEKTFDRDEIISALQAARGHYSAVELAELLSHLMGSALCQSILITYFKRAFPQIPLRVLLQAGGWNRVSGGGVSDEQFNEMLYPWLS